MELEAMSELKKLADSMIPFGRFIGVEFVSAEKDRVVARLEVTPELCGHPEVINGGAIMAFADTVGAAGAVINLPEGMWTTTLESKTNFVAPVPLGTVLTAETTPIHRGRRTMIWQTRLTTSKGKLAAVVVQTQMVLEK